MKPAPPVTRYLCISRLLLESRIFSDVGMTGIYHSANRSEDVIDEREFQAAMTRESDQIVVFIELSSDIEIREALLNRRHRVRIETMEQKDGGIYSIQRGNSAKAQAAEQFGEAAGVLLANAGIGFTVRPVEL